MWMRTVDQMQKTGLTSTVQVCIVNILYCNTFILCTIYFKDNSDTYCNAACCFVGHFVLGDKVLLLGDEWQLILTAVEKVLDLLLK